MAERKRTYVKWTTELAKEYAESKGCKLVSKYIPTKKGKMTFACGCCGNQFSITWSRFKERATGLCADCATERFSRKKSHVEFVSDIKTLYGNSVTVLGTYTGSRERVQCRCNICGYSGWFISPWKLSERKGCLNCCNNSKAKGTKQFIHELKIVHGDKFTVTGNYVNIGTKIEVKCNDCGNVWEPVPHDILRGTGCPNCVSYRGEVALRDLMQSLQLPFKQQFTFPDCRGARGGVCRFDCAVLSSLGQSPLLLIEFDGAQHFKPVEFFGGQQAFEYRQRNDRIKDRYCKDHGIPLLRISYKQFDQIEQLVTDKLYELNILQKEAA